MTIDGIEDFLAARLDDTEATAHQANQTSPAPWKYTTRQTATARHGWICDTWGTVITVDFRGHGSVTAPIGMHMALHDPAAVLDDIDAKRRLLSLFGSIRKIFPDYAFAVTGLRMLAMPYRHHPDYRPEWSI